MCCGSAVGLREPEKEDFKNSQSSCTFHPYGRRDPGPTAMTFSLLDDFIDIINRAKFGSDRLRVFVMCIEWSKKAFSHT